ncbi:hypothetical protein LTS18_001460, partial [Coniosporium uncinatum]
MPAVKANIQGTWRKAPDTHHLAVVPGAISTHKAPGRQLNSSVTQWSAVPASHNCHQAATIFSSRFYVPHYFQEAWSKHKRVSPNDQHFFETFNWALTKVSQMPGLDQWMEIGVPFTNEVCERCAPMLPRLQWSITKQGTRNVMSGREDAKQAGNYEGAMKRRPDVWQLDVLVDDDDIAYIEIGLNILSMVHRASSRLQRTFMGEVSRLHWRLDTNYVAPSKGSFPSLRLTSNLRDAEHPQIPQMIYALRKEQRRSLTWMRQQESSSVKPFTLEEIEEARIPSLRWRAECRAQKDIVVKGGVLADQVSYGKTVTTLALIEAEFQDKSFTGILNEMQ